MSAPQIFHPCTVCYKATTNWCSRCQSGQWYCSPDCLASDWPRHKKNCRPYQPPPTNSIPSTPTATSPAPAAIASFSALLFHQDEERPRVVKVDCWPAQGNSAGPCAWSPLVNSHLDGSTASVVLTQGLNGEPLRFPLHVFYVPDALAGGTPINRSILRITAGQAPRKWCGSVLALKFSGSRRQGYMDSTTNDLPALVAYFLAYK